MKISKRTMIMVMSLVLTMTVAAFGTVAYMTDSDQVTNTFTVGSVKIEVYENGEETPDAIKPLGVLTPVVSDEPSDDVSYKDKVVDVKNTGKNDAYIRVHIAMPTDLVDYLQLDVKREGWSAPVLTEATVERVDYTVITYDYLTPVAPNAITAELLQGVYLKSNVDLEETADGDLEFILRAANGTKLENSGFIAHELNDDGSYTSVTVNVMVFAQAIQTEGFGGATEALNAGFGVNTNPWK